MSQSAHPSSPPDTAIEPALSEVTLTLIHSPEPPNYYTQGMQQPLDAPASLTSRELQTIRSWPGHEGSQHLVASTVLRCAGVQTSIMDFEAYRAALYAQKELEKKAKVSRPALGRAALKVSEAESSARPYIEVMGELQPHVVAYLSLVKNETFDRSTVREKVTRLYDATDKLDHPGLRLIQESKGVIGDQAFDADRIFRIALLGFGDRTLAKILS